MGETGSAGLRVAVAASGLQHIKRGVESWAEDLGEALRGRGVEAITFQGSGPEAPGVKTVGCLKRKDKTVQRALTVLRRIGGWRVSLGSGYEVEQSSFVFRLWWRIRKDFDILHVQDPVVALHFDRLHRMGLSRPRVIFAHGTEEPPELLRRYSNLQLLAPCYAEDWEPQRPAEQAVFTIPNPVDTQRFRSRPELRPSEREALGVPADTLLIVCVAALRITHKRLDYLLREFDIFQRGSSRPAMLLIAGAADLETPQLVEMAGAMGGNVRILQNLSRDAVANLLQAADIFTLTSLQEMQGIAILEGMATGLPVACHANPVMEYVVGAGGLLADFRREGALASQLDVLSDREVRVRLGHAARQRAVSEFSVDVVSAKTLTMYDDVMRRP